MLFLAGEVEHKERNHMVCLLRHRFVAGLMAVWGIFLLFYILVYFFPREQVCFDKGCLKVELALTPQQRAQGLMFRKNLPRDKGMLFVFEDDDYWVFWMKNTYVPLDMIWLNADKKVVHIVKDIQPVKEGGNLPRYMPNETARYVLEAGAGFCGKNNIQLGDQARFKWIFLPRKL